MAIAAEAIKIKFIGSTWWNYVQWFYRIRP